MIKDKYEIYINKRPYLVPYTVMLCHATGEFKTLQSYDVYSKFLRDYRIPKENMLNVINTIQDYYGITSFIVSKDWVTRQPLTTAKNSLLFLGWLADFTVDYRAWLSITDVINKHLNYSQLTFSKEYKSINPINMFYKHLTLSIDLKSKDRTVYIKEKVYPSDIEHTLNKLGYTNINYKDIEKDIHHHCVLTKYKDYYIWGSEVILNWLVNTSSHTLYVYNISKDLGYLNFG